MEELNIIDWQKKHIAVINNEPFSFDDFEQDEIKDIKWREQIEPWLTSIFQSEHFSLLIGTGLTTAVTNIANIDSQAMQRIEFNSYKEEIKSFSDESAKNSSRGKANFEDDFRSALELLKGLIIQNRKNRKLEIDINNKLSQFIKNILINENKFFNLYNTEDEKAIKALEYLKSFIISFASRTATRERLNIFTTNYDRFIEFGCDICGILILDRFIGKISPIFRSTKLDLDYHYNPPGIRGEPRYVEGVVRLYKVHGSIDWQFEKDYIKKSSLPFGADISHPGLPRNTKEHIVIYPNSAKGIDTAFYPYSELFRDFSAGICRPNSVVVTYGYGFGDSHINRILSDMLTIPSTHLVIISYNKADGRLEEFFKTRNKAQFTLLIGEHFGDLENLVDRYLPKAAIDRIQDRYYGISEKRSRVKELHSKEQNEE